MINLNLINVDPPTRINDRWLLTSHDLKDLVSGPDSMSYKNFYDDFAQHPSHQLSQLSQQSFLHVVTETVYHYPNTYITEKTIKPIVDKRPFVLIAPPGSLKNLKSLGFKTFDQHWDESYDSIVDPEQRLLAVVNIVELICQKSMSDIQNLCIQMSDVLNFNFQFYINNFKNNEISRLENACLRNLKPRYDPN